MTPTYLTLVDQPRTEVLQRLASAGLDQDFCSFLIDELPQVGQLYARHVDGSTRCCDLAGGHVTDVLEGRRAPDGTTAIGVIVGSSIGSTKGLRTIVIQDRQGKVASLVTSATTLGDAPTLLRVDTNEAVRGLVVVALRRSLGLPTLELPGSTNSFWAYLWLAEVLRDAEHFAGIGPYDTMGHLRLLADSHPALLPAEIDGCEDAGELLGLLRQRHRDHVRLCDWNGVLDMALGGVTPLPPVRPVRYARWHDDASFGLYMTRALENQLAELLYSRDLPLGAMRRTIGRICGLLSLGDD